MTKTLLVNTVLEYSDENIRKVINTFKKERNYFQNIVNNTKNNKYLVILEMIRIDILSKRIEELEGLLI